MRKLLRVAYHYLRIKLIALEKEHRINDDINVPKIRLIDAAGYTMVKKNWFNGLQMPAIVVKRLDGTLECVRSFSYEDFRTALS